MKTLNIAADLKLPLDAVTQTFAILAKRGVGKTYCASVMAEEMLKAGQPIVALDPTGAWWGLRSEFPVVIIGGEHADVPLEVSAGEVIAQSIVENRFPAVVDLSLLRKGQMIQFMVAFAETLYRLNREALHLFVDEADAFAPQAKNYGGEENRMLGAMEDIVRRGRKRGIGCTLITQRPAVLNKNVLTQCEVLVSLRLVHPKDIDAVEEWVNVQAEPKQAQEMISSLPSLPIGDAWFWSPGWGEFFKRVHVRERETFDSGATPKAGETIHAPKKLAPIDVKALGEKIQATVEKAKANDPAALHRRIAELESELKKKHPALPAKIETKTVEVEVPAITAAERGDLHRAVEGAEDAARELDKAAKAIAAALERVGQKHPATLTAADVVRKYDPAKPLKLDREAFLNANAPIQTSGQERETTAAERELGAGPATMVAVLHAAGRPLTRRALGTLAGCPSGISTFRNNLSKLRTSGLLAEDGDTVALSPEGLKWAKSHDLPPPDPRAILAKLAALPMRMLEVLAAHSEPLTRKRLGAMVGSSSKVSTYRNALSQLRVRELLAEDGETVSLSPEARVAVGEAPRLSQDELLATRRAQTTGLATKMFDVLVQAYPSRLYRDELGREAGVDHGLSTFRNALSQLRVLELLDEDGDTVRATPELFIDGRSAA